MLGRINEFMRRRSSLFAGFYNYTIYVQTGDKPNAGTDANVYVIMHGDSDLVTGDIKLSSLFRDNFERAHLDKFKIKYQPFSVLHHIEIWRDASGFNSDWFLATVMILNQETKVKTVFPIFRWIRPNYRYKFFPLDTSLPQHISDASEQRQRELEEKREIYQLTVNAPGLPPQCKNMPADEHFQSDFTRDIAILRTKLAVSRKLVHLTTGSWTSIEDIKNVFNRKTFQQPEDIDRWRDDAAFGLQRLAGVNNVFIRRCRSIPSNFAVTDDMVAPFLEDLTLPLALSDRRIFILDYYILADVPTLGEYKVCAPIALFYERNDGTLVPIAIQLFQEPADDNPVFLPSDPTYTWALAKMWFNHADACVHQAVVLFGSTQLMMEGIAVVTKRQISQSHPLYKLLAPHLRHLIATNQRAYERILNPGNSWLEACLSLGLDGYYELIRRFTTIWRMDVHGTLPADMRERGVKDPDILKQYHFRDDALTLYEVIEKYVTNYLKVYYVSDDDILDDVELRGWREEMVKGVDEGGLGLHGVPGDSDRFTSRRQLALAVTCIIYTCSVAHAAAKYKQYDEYAFPPNYPSRLNGAPPRDKTPASEEDVLSALPDKNTTLDVMKVTKYLSERHSSSLGDFGVSYVYDPKAVKILREFKEDLKKASGTIRTRQKNRTPSYPVLDPTEIPNNICL